MELVISSLLMSLFCALAFRIIIEKRISVQNFIVVVILYALFLTIGYKFMNVLRFFISITVLTSINYYYFKEKLFKTIIGTFMIFVIIAISEVIVMLFLIGVLGLKVEVIITNYYGKLLVNILVFIIALLILKIPSVYLFLREKLEKIELRLGVKYFILFLLVFTNFFMLIHYIYFDGAKIVLITLYFASLIFSTLLFINIIITKNEREIIKNKYVEIMSDVENYEAHLEKMRIINHENINNLIVIKDMAKDDEVKTYIGTLIGHNTALNDSKLEYLPLGGIRGIVAQKMDICEKRNIKFELFIEKGLKISKKDGICRLLGIYLDNAIDAADESIVKEIRLGFYKKEITISNTYTGYIEYLKMNDKGFSSKGIGRGYGLYIASKILKETGIKTESEISDIYKLKIKSF